MSEIKMYSTGNQLAAAAAELFTTLANRATNRKGTFSVALAGGGTPLPVYELLAKDTGGTAWNKIHFFWGDERPVPKYHPDSNYQGAYQSLLDPCGVPGENIHRIQTELDPQVAAGEYQEEILAWFEKPLPCFDLILLGMGSDGHTASLFPDTDVVNNPDDYDLVAANFVPQLETWRITFTPKLINAAQQVVFLVSGQNKAEVLVNVIEGPYFPKQYPSQMILPISGQLLWLIDQDAGSLLSII